MIIEFMTVKEFITVNIDNEGYRKIIKAIEDGVKFIESNEIFIFVDKIVAIRIID